MNLETHQPLPKKNRLNTPTLGYICIILSSSLGFLIQPLMGKSLIPFIGGVPASWIGSLLFFQTSLLLGYLWAFWLLKTPTKIQVLLTLTLAIISTLTFHTPNPTPQSNASVLNVLWTLSKTCLPACITLFSTTLLISGWLSTQNKKIPYTIYAISNLGSLSGLLLYALLLEPSLTLATQTHLWHSLLILLTLLLILLSIQTLHQQKTLHPAECTAQLNPNPSEIKKKEIAIWIILSALACSLMMAATFLLCGELGSNPITWIAPFGLYLLAFSLSFSGKIPLRELPSITLITLGSFLIWCGSKPIQQSLGPTLLASLFGACLILLTKLYHCQSPNPNHYKTYLLCLAIGGSLGGLTSSFAIPLLFQNPTEFTILIAISLSIGSLTFTTKKHYIVALALLLAALALINPFNEQKKKSPKPFPLYKRDHLSSLKIDLQGPMLTVNSHTTLHGSQIVSSPETPTSYYSKSSPPGLYLTDQKKPLTVGIVGLSSGTLAAYAKNSDHYTFWDIDPKTTEIATNLFTYIPNSKGETQIQIGDGRLQLQNSQKDFDALIIDAYSGDAIPPHLITQEAFQIYKTKLEKKDGVLFIHHSNRYSNYQPIIEKISKSLNLNTLTIHTDPSKIDPGGAPSVYTLITSNPNPQSLLQLNPTIHTIIPTDNLEKTPLWTDQFNSASHTILPKLILRQWFPLNLPKNP
jgi:hypothetical protein